jgi:siroheme synthase
VDAGKRAGLKLLTQDEINSLLVDYAGRYETVVRLKGGDPLLFGRASEEIEALRHAKVSYEIIPGITAAFGAAAAAGFSLTDRRAASQVLITTFSRGSSVKSLGWREVTADTTLAVYMPGTDYAEVASRLLDAGLDPQTPCAVISHATRPEQQIRWTNVGLLFDEALLPAPSVLIVGKVATQDEPELHLAKFQNWFEANQTEQAPLQQFDRN